MGLLDILFPQKIEELPPEMKEVAEKFRRGIAKALGVPPEEISEEKVYKWVTNWAKAFIKPEYWKKYGLAGMVRVRIFGEAVPLPTPEEAEKLGYELGLIIKAVI